MSVLQSSSIATGQCLHCGKPSAAHSAFCQSCGKALPTGAAPRVVKQADLADTPAGQTLQADLLAKETRTAANALLFVAVIQTLGAVAISALAWEQIGVVGCAVLSTIAAAFMAFAIWARSSPLPAAICGLVLFVAVHLLDALADPTALTRGLLIKVVVIVFLARGISAALKRRQLAQRMNLEREV